MKTIEFKDISIPDSLASQIADQWQKWDSARQGWINERKELRNYIFQTSTEDTSNAALPWKNSTATPKICQIRDNLHANYMAALFPNERWLTWMADDEKAAEAKKKNTIEHYMINKTEKSGFRSTVSQLVYDWIDAGNAFATTEYILSSHELNKEKIVQYSGPKVVRISPYDIVFNPLAVDFESSPKIIRTLTNLGDIKRNLLEKPEMGYQEAVFQKALELRQKVSQLSPTDQNKAEGLSIDGFGNIFEYFSSGTVELLELIGDVYDSCTGTLYHNVIVTVIDRSYILRNVPIPSWNVNRIRHVGWRLRPDNLYAMGPLDNLVGMQYRIDHLENLKADVFDLIAHPVIKIKGHVEDFNYGPGERITVSEDGDVEFLHPDATALNAETQIAVLEQKMEDFAGAPKQAMGIRTPGEKTKFEVQVLENAAGRIFQNKISYFEQVFLEPLLNDMLECSRRNMNGTDIIRVLRDDIDVALFSSVSKEDLIANGSLRPIGARHFATEANTLQNFVQLANSSLGQDPDVKAHISGKKLAKLVEKLLGAERFGLVQDNIRIAEQMETQRLIQTGQETLQTEAMTPAGVTADEMIEEPQLDIEGAL